MEGVEVVGKGGVLFGWLLLLVGRRIGILIICDVEG